MSRMQTHDTVFSRVPFSVSYSSFRTRSTHSRQKMLGKSCLSSKVEDVTLKSPARIYRNQIGGGEPIGTNFSAESNGSRAVNSSSAFQFGSVKRTYEGAKLDEQSMADDEPDYPRKKKIPRLVSRSNKGILAYTEGSGSDDDRFPGESGTDYEDGDDDLCGDEDDEEIENEEEAAIIAEAIHDGDLMSSWKSGPSFGSSGILDLAAINTNALEDLDKELFQSQWNDPHRFSDLNNPFHDFLPFHVDFDNHGNLFSVNPTPGRTPETIPRGSIPGNGNCGIDSLQSNSEEGSDDDIVDLESLFEKGTKDQNRIISSGGKQSWGDDTDDDADLVKYFFSSAEEDEDSGNESDKSDISDEGETTDEDVDLPAPTPRHKSILRRVSMQQTHTSRPQVVCMDGGPQLCHWIADPSRPICVIEGNKQTFLIPEWYGLKQSQEIDEEDSKISNCFVSTEDSESEQSTLKANFDPALSALICTEGRALNINDSVDLREAFLPVVPDELTLSDVFNEGDVDFHTGSEGEEVDEYEAGLELSDFLDFSSSSDDAGKTKDLLDGLSDEIDVDEEISNTGNDDLLAVWNRVSVTAFRKRQLQHSQKLATLHTGHLINPNNYGYHKGKEDRLAETITPTKKRRVRQKFLSNHRGSKRPGHQPSR